MVFSKKAAVYNPIMTEGKPYTDKARPRGNQLLEKSLDIKTSITNTGTRYPASVIDFSNPNHGNIHPTQKPVALFEYLIKTYTNEGALVLDNCAGSGTTAIACLNTNREYICMEKDETYFQLMQERVQSHG